MSKTVTKTVPCAGCDKPVGHISGARIRVGVEEKLVCPGRGAHYSTYGYGRESYPSVTCRRKALEKAQLCPGCGADNTWPGTICRDCRAKLDRVRDLDDEKVYWYGLAEQLVGPYLGTPYSGNESEGSEAPQRVLELVAQIASAKGPRRWQRGWPEEQSSIRGLGRDGSCHSGMVFVQLDPDQRVAIEALGDALAKLSKAQYLDGRFDGEGVLRRLAKGEVSIDEFSEHHINQAREMQQVRDDLTEFGRAEKRRKK